MTVTGNSDGILASAPAGTTLTVTSNVVTGDTFGSSIVAIGPAMVRSNSVAENLFGITTISTTSASVDVSRNSVRNGQIGIDVASTSGQVTANSVCVAPGDQTLVTGGGLTVSGNVTNMSCP